MVGIVTFSALIICCIVFFFGCFTVIWKSSREFNIITKKIKSHARVIRIREDSYSSGKFKEINIMLSNYGYVFEGIEASGANVNVRVYRRK